jgi:hypothetical protein
MSNILVAFSNIIQNYQINVSNIQTGNNRANNMGEGLEAYIKSAFASNFLESDKKKVKSNLNSTFSYMGSKNNPPDIILKSSDAIEVKKVEQLGTLQFNSSHPKSKLLSSNPKIKAKCKECDGGLWVEKDILYAVGHVPKGTKQLKSLWFVYGVNYAADKEVYTSVETKVKDALNLAKELDIITDTKELGRVTSIDSMDITYLRIRGMWVIKHPAKVFSHLYEQDTNSVFSLVAIIPLDKYSSFPKKDRDNLESLENVQVSDETVPDPNNACDLMNVKLLIFSV